MTQSAVDDRLSQARSAVQRLAWTEAHELLTELDAAGGLDPDDLANLARACHWTGRMDDCLDTYARSYALYLAGGNTRGAAFVALELVRWHRHKLAGAVAAGWLRRAERLLEDDGDSREYGYLQLRHAHGALAAGDLERAAELAQIAHEYGRRHGDRDLELLGLHDYGLALVELGQVEEGFAHVDEAAAAAVAVRPARSRPQSSTATRSAPAATSPTTGVRATGRRRRSAGATSRRSTAFPACAVSTAPR